MSVCASRRRRRRSVFFFNDTATTEIYPPSLHGALPIYCRMPKTWLPGFSPGARPMLFGFYQKNSGPRSEEHTSELQSQSNLVCRLLLEKKKPLPNKFHLTHPEERPRTLTYPDNGHHVPA